MINCACAGVIFPRKNRRLQTFQEKKVNSEILLATATAGMLATASLATAVGVGEFRGGAVTTQRKAVLVTLVFLLLSGFVAASNLGHPEMILGALGNPGSGIFLEIVGCLLLGISCVLYFFALRQEDSVTFLKTGAGCLMVSGLILAFAVGKSCYMPWRAAWNTYSIVLPSLAWWILGTAFFLPLLEEQSEEKVRVQKLAVYAGLACVVVALACYAGSLYFLGTEESQQIAASLFSGNRAVLFIGGAFVFGAVLPALLSVLKAFPSRALLVAGIVSIFVGSLAYQWLIFQLGVASWQFVRHGAV
jgi:hypothetical protein